jgi:hypothetical protein
MPSCQTTQRAVSGELLRNVSSFTCNLLAAIKVVVHGCHTALCTAHQSGSCRVSFAAVAAVENHCKLLSANNCCCCCYCVLCCAAVGVEAVWQPKRISESSSSSYIGYNQAFEQVRALGAVHGSDVGAVQLVCAAATSLSQPAPSVSAATFHCVSELCVVYSTHSCHRRRRRRSSSNSCTLHEANMHAASVHACC